jgi:hypothetical protein
VRKAGKKIENLKVKLLQAPRLYPKLSFDLIVTVHENAIKIDSSKPQSFSHFFSQLFGSVNILLKNSIKIHFNFIRKTKSPFKHFILYFLLL